MCFQAMYVWTGIPSRGHVYVDCFAFSWPCICGLSCLLVAVYVYCSAFSWPCICGLSCLLVAIICGLAMYMWIARNSRGHVCVDCSAFSWPCVCVACSDVLDLRGWILLPSHGHVWIVLFSLGHVWTGLLLHGHVCVRCYAFSRIVLRCVGHRCLDGSVCDLRVRCLVGVFLRQRADPTEGSVPQCCTTPQKRSTDRKPRH